MSGPLVACGALVALIFSMGGWLAWQLLRQNGRLLLRVEELEKRLDEMEFGEPDDHQSEEAHSSGSQPSTFNSQPDNQSLVTSTLRSSATEDGSAARNGDDRANRFSSRSVARSRIKRAGLKAGTPAPDFRLPRLDGRGELALEELLGRRVLLVFSDPHCGPCNALTPELARFHRQNKQNIRPPSPLPSPPREGELSPIEVVMISRGEPKENRAKVKEHRLNFPVVLQQQWEISSRYAMFATPVAYLIDEAGVIAQDVAVGTDAIRDLMARAVPLRNGLQAVA